MSAQGVPGFITIQREIRQFRKYYDETVAINIGKFSELLASMVAMFSSLPQQVISLLLERIRVEGAREVTIEDIRALIMETLQSPFGPFTQISDQLRRMEARMGSESQAAVSSEQQQGNPLQFSTPAGGSFFYWPGIDSRFHRVPYGFKFPSYVTGTMWNLWFFGDLSRKIGPYKHITPANDLPNSGCRSNACRTKLVIKKMVEIAVDGHLVVRQDDINNNNNQAVYDYSMARLLTLLYSTKPPGRPEDININTLGERLKKKFSKQH